MQTSDEFKADLAKHGVTVWNGPSGLTNMWQPNDCTLNKNIKDKIHQGILRRFAEKSQLTNKKASASELRVFVQQSVAEAFRHFSGYAGYNSIQKAWTKTGCLVSLQPDKELDRMVQPETLQNYRLERPTKAEIAVPQRQAQVITEMFLVLCS